MQAMVQRSIQTQQGVVDSPHKSQVKANRQLEVQLNGCTLVVTSNCIFDFNINLQRHTKKTVRPFQTSCKVQQTVVRTEGKSEEMI